MAAGGGRKGSRGQWVFLEAMGYPEMPMTILAVGGAAKQWTSPSRVIGDQALEVAQNMHRRAMSGDVKPSTLVLTAGENRKVSIEPVIGPFDVPHGYHVWVGPADMNPGPPPPAAGYTWDSELLGVYSTWASAAMSGTPREEYHDFWPVSDFTRRAVKFDDTMELAQFGLNLAPGNTFLTEFSSLHIRTGAVMPWILAMKAVSPTRARGIFYDQTDFGVEPPLPDATELGLLQMAEENDRYLALMVMTQRPTGAEMVLGTWLTSTPPWARYDKSLGESYIHPDDRSLFTTAWAVETTAKVVVSPGTPAPPAPRYPVRLAGWEDDEWVLTSSAIRPYVRGGMAVEGLFIMEVTRA